MESGTSDKLAVPACRSGFNSIVVEQDLSCCQLILLCFSLIKSTCQCEPEAWGGYIPQLGKLQSHSCGTFGVASSGAGIVRRQVNAQELASLVGKLTSTMSVTSTCTAWPLALTVD
eukprot:2791542-Amphidinium_carterae.1